MRIRGQLSRVRALPTNQDLRQSPAEADVSLATWGQRAGRAMLRWTAVVALVSGGLGLVLDGTRLWLAGSGLPIVWAGALSTAGMAVLMSFVAGPIFAAVAAADARLASGGLVAQLLSPVPALASAFLAAFVITSVRHWQDSTMRLTLAVGAAVLIAVCILAARPSAHRLLRVSVLGVTGGIFLVDAMLPHWYYREIHDVLALVTLCGLVAIVAPRRRRIGSWRLAIFLATAAVFSVAVLKSVDWAAPGWRTRAAEHGLYGRALARAARALVDFDQDGYSSVAWGGDCDDFSSRRNPLAMDGPGQGDMNCNGVDPPSAPTEEQRGLAPAAGEPSLPADAVDLVVLVTVDALRADSLTPQLMPRLTAAAARGILFEKSYACGTRTMVSLPLMQSAHRGGMSLADRLETQYIVTTAVIGDHLLEGNEVLARCFDRLVMPSQGRWQGGEATAHALAAIDEVAARRHFLWLHYYDAHTPYPEVAESPVPTPPGLHASYANYATGVAAVDVALDHLLAGLARRGMLARAVVIITADHGEAFGEHGMLFHGASAYQPLVHVPSILLAPGLVPGRYAQLVSHTDIFPTVTGAFAQHRPEDEIFGRSWLRLRMAPAAPLHSFVIIRSARAVSGDEAMSPLLAIVDDRYKLTKTFEDGLTELFDISADPGERVDLWPVEPAMGRRLERALETYRDIVGYPADEEMAKLKTVRARMIDPHGQIY